MYTLEHAVTDPMGLHARPAGILVKKAAAFNAAAFYIYFFIILII